MHFHPQVHFERSDCAVVRVNVRISEHTVRLALVMSAYVPVNTVTCSEDIVVVDDSAPTVIFSIVPNANQPRKFVFFCFHTPDNSSS